MPGSKAVMFSDVKVGLDIGDETVHEEEGAADDIDVGDVESI